MKYITGQYALNIHHREDVKEPTGDWHGLIWDNIMKLPDEQVDYAGDGCFINTLHIWDNYGIYNDTDHMKKKNIIINEEVFVADYYRAILDLVYYGLIKYGKINHLNCITADCLDTEDQVLKVMNKVIVLEKTMNKKQIDELHRWIYNERNYEKIRNEGMLNGY